MWSYSRALFNYCSRSQHVHSKLLISKPECSWFFISYIKLHSQYAIFGRDHIKYGENIAFQTRQIHSETKDHIKIWHNYRSIRGGITLKIVTYCATVFHGTISPGSTNELPSNMGITKFRQWELRPSILSFLIKSHHPKFSLLPA